MGIFIGLVIGFVVGALATFIYFTITGSTLILLPNKK